MVIAAVLLVCAVWMGVLLHRGHRRPLTDRDREMDEAELRLEEAERRDAAG